MINSNSQTALSAPFPCKNVRMETSENGHQPSGVKEYRIVDFWSDGPVEPADVTDDASALIAPAYAVGATNDHQSWSRRLLNWL